MRDAKPSAELGARLLQRLRQSGAFPEKLHACGAEAYPYGDQAILDR